MDLILWRHAEAEEIQPGQFDGDRVLTAKGRRQATRMALWLRSHLPVGTRVLVSPARRTQETATHLGLPYATEPRLAISESAEGALAAAAWPQHEGACLLVGHQPMLGQIIGKLLQTERSDWSVKKGSIWWFSTRETGPGVTEIILNTVLGPKDIELKIGK